MNGFYRYVTVPLWMLREGGLPIYGYARGFEALSELSRPELQQRQTERLRATVLYAVKNVPYYREVFARTGIALENVTPQSIQCLPILTKRDIRDRGAELRAGLPAAETREDSTGGSTGLPMRFARSRRCANLRRAQEMFFDSWFGVRLGDKVGLFVSASHHVGGRLSARARLRSATFERMLRFDPAKTTPDEIAEFLPKLVRFQPDVIRCFPNALKIFLDYCEAERVALPTVRNIFCTGETLYAHHRQQFERAFSGKTVERYGTKECGLIASECPAHDGLHIFTEGCFVEILKDSGEPCKAGETGKVVVTDLFNDAMPLIRYEIGDRAIAGEESACRCGSALPRLAKILGRDRDIIYTRAGTARPGYLFVDAVTRRNLDAQVQVVQEDDGNVILRICELKSPEEVLEATVADLQALVGEGLSVSVRREREIPRDPSGKYAYVASSYRPVVSRSPTELP